MSGETIRTVFMGTPAFAVPSLRDLLEIGWVGSQPISVVGVFTQPDRPAGRGNRITASPVKQEAQSRGIPVFQPERLRRPEAFATLQALSPDLIVVAAFAQILPQRVLDLPRYGCLNVHASLLPKYRGAAPIQAVILNGDPDTGVCIMLMEAGLDTGPVVACQSEPISGSDTAASLGDRLALIGASLLAQTVPPWIRGEITPQAQDESRATITTMLRKEDGALDWSQRADQLERRVRAMNPWPGAFTVAGGTLLKIHKARVIDGGPYADTPGTLLEGPSQPRVVTTSGMLELVTLQPAGKRSMSGAEWLRGAHSLIGTVLGNH